MARITRRRFLQLVGEGSTAIAGGSLGTAGLGWLSPALAQAQRPYAGQTMSHWDFLSPDGKSAREIAIKEIEGRFKERTGVTVAFQTMPWQDLGTKLIAAVQAGNAPDNSRVNLFALKMVLKADSLVNLDPFVKKAFTDTDRKDFTVDFTPPAVVNGSTWTMQIETIPKALFVRKDMLAKAGVKPPRTWAELVEVAKAVTGNGKWGYMYNGSKTQLNQVETIFQPHIHGRGGHILDASEKATFNDDAAVRSYQFLADCVHKYKITPQQVIGMTYDEVTDSFKAGRVAMIQEGAHRYRDVAKAVGSENLELVKVPSDDPNRPSPSIVTGWGLGIPRGSKNPDLSWDYIREYISPEAQEINARIAGLPPSRKSVLNLPYFQTPDAAYMRWWMDYVAQRSEIVINVGTFAQLNEVMIDALHKALTNPSLNIKQTLDESVKTYNQMARV
jgi:multiple sugar transport system substrate-binding protein